MKECTKCHRFLAESEYSKDRSHKDGLNSWCKQCKNEYIREFHLKRVENKLCYDCGTPLTDKDKQKRFCLRCYNKRLGQNAVSERKHIQKGICRQCGKQPIDYSRSRLHCSSCLDKRNENKILRKYKYNMIENG